MREILDSAELREGAGRVRDQIAAMPAPDEVLATLAELVSRGPGSSTGRT